MRYFFNYSVSGMVDDRSDSGRPESVQEIQKVITDSFPHDLLAGITLQSVNLNVHMAPELPSGVGQSELAQAAQVPYRK